jgi:hypothetical protein
VGNSELVCGMICSEDSELLCAVMCGGDSELLGTVVEMFGRIFGDRVLCACVMQFYVVV